MDEWISGSIDGRVSGWIDRVGLWMSGWMDEWISGSIDGLVSGWMSWSMDE